MDAATGEAGDSQSLGTDHAGASSFGCYSLHLDFPQCFDCSMKALELVEGSMMTILVMDQPIALIHHADHHAPMKVTQTCCSPDHEPWEVLVKHCEVHQVESPMWKVVVDHQHVVLAPTVLHSSVSQLLATVLETTAHGIHGFQVEQFRSLN